MQTNKKIVLITLVASLFILIGSCASIVYAPPPPHYDYNVTSDHHGIDVNLGETVNVWATTTDPTVYEVTFTWKNAAEIVVWGPEPSASDEWIGGVHYFYATPHAPNSLGDWGVNTDFHSPNGHIQQTDIIAQRSTSFDVKSTTFNDVPEVPLIGTIGALSMMLLGFIYMMKRKNHN